MMSMQTSKFQSLTGRLKTSPPTATATGSRQTFQSLTGRLKTPRERREHAQANARFNPSQVG